MAQCLTLFTAVDLLARDLGYVDDAIHFRTDCDAAIHGEESCVERFSYDRIVFLVATLAWLLIHIRWIVFLWTGRFFRSWELVVQDHDDEQASALLITTGSNHSSSPRIQPGREDEQHEQQQPHTAARGRRGARADRRGAAVHGCGLCGGGTFSRCECEQTEEEQ